MKRKQQQWKENLIIVRGGGDIATGTIYKLFQCGFPLLVLEIANPSCIRRTISFCEAVFDEEVMVENVSAKKVSSLEEAYEAYLEEKIPVMVDAEGEMIRESRPAAVVDAILAKRNLGTTINDAPVVIGVGPGFTAGEDVHAVVETMRGHNLGRVLYEGSAAPNTGIPGIIAGYGKERVIHAPCSGTLHIERQIGETVEQGETIAVIDGTPVPATLSGVLRGMIREGYEVHKGLKIADIDPRISEKENCFRISDKARCVAGGVLEAIMHLAAKGEQS
ncbi:MAG: selenium-dependent molybdenum cofactor biosynthesis protein YqeB [Eubacteriales bacterium]|nr:selenium-dependent molybdenum cofactor biosynthesis protein YqeB [Eubacteriales bacterium]